MATKFDPSFYSLDIYIRIVGCYVIEICFLPLLLCVFELQDFRGVRHHRFKRK